MTQTSEGLEQRVGPILRDGVALRDLIDFDKREVSMRVLNDPEIHRLELKRLFARQWIGLAHDTEIPNPGDFVLRYQGEDQVIVTRTDDGGVRVLLNVCAHRGMSVCWADEGNSSKFRCPYHGWTFDNEGSLLGAPFERAMYGDWDKSQFGLRTARVGIRHGLIFATFDESAPAFEEWLGDSLWYLDRLFGNPEWGTEWESIGGRTRYTVHSNWKVAADQFMGDGYHVLTLHQSMLEAQALDATLQKAWRDIEVLEPTRSDAAARVAGQLVDMAEVENARASGGRSGRYAARIASSGGHGVWTFGSPAEDDPNNYEGNDPNDFSKVGGLLLWFNPATRVSNAASAGGWRSGPNNERFMTLQLHTLVPRGPGRFEVWGTQLVPKGLPEELKDWHARCNAVMQSFNADDVLGWPQVQRPLDGVISQEQPLRYNSLRGENRPDGWPGPGKVYVGFPHDDTQWHYWQRWFELMTNDEA